MNLPRLAGRRTWRPTLRSLPLLVACAGAPGTGSPSTPTAPTATIAVAAMQSVVTTAVSAGVAPGRYTFTVTGSAPGVRAVHTTLVVRVAGADSAPPAPDGALDGIYLGLRTNFEGRQYQDFWTFLPGGHVLRTDPDEGLDRPVDVARLCERFACGTYARTGSELRIRWAPTADATVYDVDADGAFHERGRTQKYRPLAPLTGLRLDATFAQPFDDGDSVLVRLRLTADGRFVEQGLMRYTAWAQHGAPGEARTALPGGTGRYAIARNTLALVYDGGPTAYFTVVVPPGEMGKAVPDVLYVNQARIARAP